MSAHTAALNTTTARASYGAVQVPTLSTVTVSVQAVGSTVDLTVHWRPETRLSIVPVQVLICWPSIGGQLMGGNMSVDLAEH